MVLIDDETIFFIWTGSEKNVSSGQGSDNHEPRSDFPKDFSLFYGSSSGSDIITLIAEGNGDTLRCARLHPDCFRLGFERIIDSYWVHL